MTTQDATVIEYDSPAQARVATAVDRLFAALAEHAQQVRRIEDIRNGEQSLYTERGLFRGLAELGGQVAALKTALKERMADVHTDVVEYAIQQAAELCGCDRSMITCNTTDSRSKRTRHFHCTAYITVNVREHSVRIRYEALPGLPYFPVSFTDL